MSMIISPSARSKLWEHTSPSNESLCFAKRAFLAPVNPSLNRKGEWGGVYHIDLHSPNRCRRTGNMPHSPMQGLESHKESYRSSVHAWQLRYFVFPHRIADWLVFRDTRGRIAGNSSICPGDMSNSSWAIVSLLPLHAGFPVLSVNKHPYQSGGKGWDYWPCICAFSHSNACRFSCMVFFLFIKI